jgi:pilus assembly protein CpaC
MVSEELTLAVGENRTIPATDVKNFSEGAPGVVEVKVTPGGGQFVVVGQKPGTTTLLLLKRDGQEITWRIHVFAQPLKLVAAELTDLLGDTPGIRVRRVGSRFFIEGGVTGEPELQRIEHVASLYPGQVESLVVLGGVAADRKINLRVDLYFVQYERNSNQQVGISWPAVIGGAAFSVANVAFDVLTRSVSSATTALVNQPLPGLDLAARNGWVKVVKHATLITANGSEAEFTNGGAQWFPAVNGLTSTLREINFGTTLKILPRYDVETSEIQVHVGADVSDLTPPITNGTTLPGQSTSKLSTSVALRLGQSLVLSGIRSSNTRHSTGGLPWLSQIPILGGLFGSSSDQNDELEGAVFIVPSVVESASQRATELVARALRDYGEYSGARDQLSPLSAAPLGGTQ